jgi:CDP-paratose 2-epimerase
MISETNGNGRNGSTRPILGLLEWFQVGDYERVEQILADAAALGIEEIRTGLSWADYLTLEGPAWYDWLLPRMRKQVNLLPCFTYTPPSEGIVPRASSPPREPKKFADFLDVAITRYGRHFEFVELWNEPNGIVDWDWRLDPEWNCFAEMIVMAAYWARQRGKKTVLGGMCPVDPNWLDLMCRRGVLENIDIVGIHGFPATWEFDWTDWSDNLRQVRQVLDWHHSRADVWITEVGYSTWRHDDFTQLLQFKAVMEADVDRVYWYSARDLPEDQAHQEGFRQDQRHYHMGLKSTDGQPKLLFRILEEEGMEGVRQLAEVTQPSLPRIYTTPMAPSAAEGKTPPMLLHPEYTLITGGAGFVGTNLADRLLSEGKRVLIYDNLSRPGVEENLRWLCQKHPRNLKVEIADVRDPFLLREAVKGADCVFHLAAQVAVTTSLVSPRHDFEANATGTLNVLEALRERGSPPPLLFTSTNKVYGALPQLELCQRGLRWEPLDREAARHGIPEETALSFHSPYGCSKGAADQYVLDYAASFGLPATVFRMSCIYGPHQFGTEDQGWVAHFLLQALRQQPITIYGDGMQVRDVLFVGDLVEAFLAARREIDAVSGTAFNIGGGPSRAVSLLELMSIIEEMHGQEPEVTFAPWRPADQRFYVSNITSFAHATRWQPITTVRDGVERLYSWLSQEVGYPPSNGRGFFASTTGRHRSVSRRQTRQLNTR